jgi:hypothetical protein
MALRNELALKLECTARRDLRPIRWIVDVNWKRCWKNVCVIVNTLYEYCKRT